MSDNGITVALDTLLTEELLTEGFVREVVSKVQTMRKDAGFNVMDHINITVEGDSKAVETALANKADIVGDTLADSLSAATPTGFIKEWDINGATLKIGVERV